MEKAKDRVQAATKHAAPMSTPEIQQRVDEM